MFTCFIHSQYRFIVKFKSERPKLQRPLNYGAFEYQLTLTKEKNTLIMFIIKSLRGSIKWHFYIGILDWMNQLKLLLDSAATD